MYDALRVESFEIPFIKKISSALHCSAHTSNGSDEVMMEMLNLKGIKPGKRKGNFVTIYWFTASNRTAKIVNEERHN